MEGESKEIREEVLEGKGNKEGIGREDQESRGGE